VAGQSGIDEKPERMISNWRASIENADLADWVTVATYLLTAILCARAARHAEQVGAVRERTFWQITVLALVLLGVNELLDLQTLFTLMARAHAKAHGWYEHRRVVQYAFIMALAAVAGLAGIAVLWFTRQTHIAVRLAQIGLTFIVAFVLLRAASFHHVDLILGRGLAGVSLGSLQEIAGILTMAAAALLCHHGR
jgi:hypothetical protein